MCEKNSFPAIVNLPVHVVATNWNWSRPEPKRNMAFGLKPEWWIGTDDVGRRWVVKMSGSDCAYREHVFAALAQRLDISCQSSMYYRLPERGAHTALGDVQTVADLFANVLRPIAGHRGLDSWEKLAAFAAEEWYPSRIAFGKHKRRLIQEARKDAELRRWLDWLAGSANSRNAKMGRWYLRQLEKDLPADATVFATAGIDGKRGRVTFKAGQAALVIYVNPELEELRRLVSGARARLAELEVDYAREKSRVDAMQAALFRRLRSPCGISRSSEEHSRIFQREPNWTGRGEPAYSTGRALPETRPVAVDSGLPEEVCSSVSSCSKIAARNKMAPHGFGPAFAQKLPPRR